MVKFVQGYEGLATGRSLVNIFPEGLRVSIILFAAKFREEDVPLLLVPAGPISFLLEFLLFPVQLDLADLLFQLLLL